VRVSRFELSRISVEKVTCILHEVITTYYQCGVALYALVKVVLRELRVWEVLREMRLFCSPRPPDSPAGARTSARCPPDCRAAAPRRTQLPLDFLPYIAPSQELSRSARDMLSTHPVGMPQAPPWPRPCYWCHVTKGLRQVFPPTRWNGKCQCCRVLQPRWVQSPVPV
jgi:hypothetical protein